MRRVFAVIGSSFLFTSVILLYFSINVSIAFIIVSAVLLLISFSVAPLRKNMYMTAVCLSVLIAAVSFLLHYFCEIEPIRTLSGTKAEIDAVCTDYGTPTKNSNKYIVRVKSVKGCGAGGFKLLIYSNEPLELSPDDRFTATLTLTDEYVDVNSDCGEGIYLSAYLSSASDIEYLDSKATFSGALANLRKYFKDKLSEYCDEDTASLLKGFLFSDRSEIDSSIVTAFYKCGLQHTMAVSGLHMSIICGTLYLLLRLILKSRRKAAVCGIISVLLLMGVVGFHYSALRSGIMMMVVFAGGLFSRRADGVNSLFLASAVFVLINPFCAVNISFLMSLSAALGLILIYAPITRKIENYEKRPVKRRLLIIALPFIQSVCAIIATLPVIYLFFGTVSLAAPFANLILLPFISIDIIFGVIFCLICPFGFLANIAAVPLGALSHIIISAALWIADVFGKVISLGTGAAGYAIAAIFVVIAVTYIMICKNNDLKRPLMRICALSCAVILLTAVALDKKSRIDEIKISFLNSGGGICTVLNCRGNITLIGAGGSSAQYALQEYEQLNGICGTSAVILPKSKNTYSQKAESVVKYLKPDTVIMDDDGDKYYAVKAAAEQIYCDEIMPIYGAQISFCGIEIIKLTPENAVYLSYGDLCMLIMDKDTDYSKLSEQYKSADVYVFVLSAPGIELPQDKIVIYCTNKAVTAANDNTYLTGDNTCLSIYTDGQEMKIKNR